MFSSSIPIGLKDRKAASAVIEEFHEAASTHRNGFLKAAGVDSFSQIFSQTLWQFLETLQRRY
jgi:hypothetical protein